MGIPRLFPAIVVLFCAVLLVNTIFSRPREAAIGVVLMLTGVPMYYWFKKNNKPQEGGLEQE